MHVCTCAFVCVCVCVCTRGRGLERSPCRSGRSGWFFRPASGSSIRGGAWETGAGERGQVLGRLFSACPYRALHSVNPRSAFIECLLYPKDACLADTPKLTDTPPLKDPQGRESPEGHPKTN